jgi:hypothetical protein
MSSRLARRGTLPVVLLSAVALLGAGSAPAAAEDGVALPITSASDMVVDAVHQHVFISAPAENSVLVTDFAGSVVTEIPAQPGASGLALSDDSATVYVALPNADAISAIDTSTLQEVARRSTGTGITPRHLAVAGGEVWFGYDSPQQGKLGSLDFTGAVVKLDQDGDHHWSSAPLLATQPHNSPVLVAASTGQSPTEMQTYDVSSGTAVSTAYASDPGGEGGAGLAGMAVDLNGRQVVTAGASPQHLQVLGIPDLGPEGSYETGASASAVALSVDGRVASGIAGTSAHDVAVFLPGNGTAVQYFDYPDGEVIPGGLAWDQFSDRLFALTQPQAGGPVSVHPETPAKAGTTLTLQAPATAKRARPLTISGTLASPIPIPDGTDVHVTRTDPASPGGTTVGTASVSSENTFSLTDTPPVAGTATYTVTYTGDAAHDGTTATATIRIAK